MNQLSVSFFSDIHDKMHLDQKDETSSHPDSSSEVHICGNCQGEFIGTTQFLQHKETCSKKQVVVIMNEEQKQHDNSEELTTPTMAEPTEKAPTTEDTSRNKHVTPLPQPIDFSSVQSLENKNLLIAQKDIAESKPSTAGYESTSRTSQAQSEISNHSNQTKRNGVKTFTSSVAVIQEQLYTLHQQHLQQMQIILQIQEKIQALVAESYHLHGASSRATEAKDTIVDHLTSTISKPPSTEASSLLQKPHPIMPSSLEMLQTQVRQTPSLPFPAFPLPPPHPPFDIFQQSQTGLQPVSSPLPVPPPLPYPGGLLSHRKGKPPNVSVFDPKFTDDAFFRHKCHFCHKVFGSDSALQIHIRSHTGERPFKCNICGNRFSTKGNLKVHFQRHQAQYPNVEMDITPYPPSPPPQDQPLQPPSIDQIPMPSITSESAKNPSGELQSSHGEHLDLTNSVKSSDEEEINNNDKHPDLQQNDEDKETSSQLENGDDRREGERPCSAPSKVISSSISPSDNIQPTSNGEIDSKDVGSSDILPASSSYSLLSGSDLMRSSETSKLQHLVESIEQKITEPNQCVICHRVLSCKNALQLHYRIHTGERPYKCKICGRTFTTKGNLKTHYGVHRAKPSFPSFHECPICQKNFANPVVLQQHLKLHAAEDMMMHSTFDSESYFREETQQERRPENLMESLQARFNYMKDPISNGDNDKHDLTRPLEDSDDVSAKRLKLTNSFYNGDSQNAKTKDMPYHLGLLPTKPDKPSSNGQRENSEGGDHFVPSPSSEEQHLMADETSSIPESALDLTPKSTSTSPDSVRSGSIYTTSASEYPGILKGEGLESGTSSPDPDMDATKMYGSGEMHQMFDSSIPSLLMGRQKNRSNTTCYFCGKTFACASALNIHYRSHTKERPFKCDVCCKGFSTRGNLKQHMLTHKIRDMPSQLLGIKAPAVSSSVMTNGCDVNPVSTQSPGEVDDSGPPKRTPSNRHQCSVCEKQFQSDSALQIHVRTHTGEKPYKCHICGRAFTTKGNMKVHLGTHMWNGGSRRGRRITMEPPLMMNPKEGDIYRNELFGFRPSLDYPFFHYPPPHPLLNGFNPLGKPNEISVIQNPHSLGMQYPSSSEASLMKNGKSGETASNIYSHPQSSGRSSPEKKSYSPSLEMERSASSYPSSQAAAAMNYLHLTRQSAGSESGQVSPEIGSYMSSEENRQNFPPTSKSPLLKGNPLSRESSSANYLHLNPSNDSKSSRYNSERPTNYLSTDKESRLLASPGHGDHGNISEKEVGQMEDSLRSASRMVDQLEAQRV